MASSQNNPPTQILVFEMQISIKDPQSSDSVTLNFALTADKPINVSFSTLQDVAAAAAQGPSRRAGDRDGDYEYFKQENIPRPHYNQCSHKCPKCKAKEYKEEKDDAHEFYGIDYLKKEEPANDPEVDHE